MHTLRDKRVVLFGGTGLIGRALAHRLAAADSYVTVVARHPERARVLMVLQRLRMQQGDVGDEDFVRDILKGQDAAVNLVGILDGPARTLRALHVDWPARLAEAASGLERLVHVSASNADPGGPSRYLRTKGEGEERISRSSAPWTVVAPSVVFGPDDGLFCRFATLLRLAPGVMPVVRPGARFSPVYVRDLAEAIFRTLLRDDLAGERLVFGGPEIWTMREILDYIRRQLGLRRLLLDLPDELAQMQGRMMNFLPGRPFSLDQFRTLTVDAIADPADFRHLDIEPTAVDAVMPQYLGAEGRQRQFDRYRQESSGPPFPPP